MVSRAATEQLTEEVVEVFEKSRRRIYIILQLTRIEKVVSERVHYGGAMHFLSASTERRTNL